MEFENETKQIIKALDDDIGCVLLDAERALNDGQFEAAIELLKKAQSALNGAIRDTENVLQDAIELSQDEPDFGDLYEEECLERIHRGIA